MANSERRVLLLATTTGYQVRTFGEAAERVGVRLVFATDRCDQLEDPWVDGAIPIRFHREDEAVDAIAAAAREAPLHGVLAVGDRPTLIAARAAARLGLRGHPPAAAAVARDKRQLRERLRDAGLPVPWFTTVPATAHAGEVLRELPLQFPVVIKPIVLSGSRGVMRADTPDAFVEAFGRLQRLLGSPDVQAMQEPGAGVVQVERYIDGVEYALEGVVTNGVVRTLALFDKPDPLEGPFFEETLYVTPARVAPEVATRIETAVGRAAAAIGLAHGPLHAEVRVAGDEVFVLEAAARPIGGLCARALAFEDGRGGRIGLEELLLRHALGEDMGGWTREAAASGVMMIPIPRAGIYRDVDGVDEARAVEGVQEIRITAKPDQALVPLPEGASYLGFIFARGQTGDAVEQALRAAHGSLRFQIDREIPVR